VELSLAARILDSFLVALGVTVAGSLSGAAASVLTGGHPMDRLRFLAGEMRLWGILVALTGSFAPLRNLEQGLLSGQLRVLGRQVLLLVAAMIGANLGYLLLMHMAGGRGDR
jgi:hypothetical protein